MAFLAALFFSLHAVLVRWGLSKCSSEKNSAMEVQLLNLFYGLVIIVIGILVTELFTEASVRNEFENINIYSFILLVTEAMLGPLAGLFLINTAIGQIGVSRSSALLSTNILFAALLSMFLLNEMPGVWGFIGILVILFGIVLVSYKSENESVSMLPQAKIKGGLFALIAAISFALSQVARGEALNHGATPIAAVITGCILPLLFITTVYLLRGNNLFKLILNLRSSNAGSYALGGIMLILARYALFLAFLHIPIWLAVAIRNIQPLIILIITWVIFKQYEIINIRLTAGIILIIGGIWAVLYF